VLKTGLYSILSVHNAYNQINHLCCLHSSGANLQQQSRKTGLRLSDEALPQVHDECSTNRRRRWSDAAARRDPPQVSQFSIFRSAISPQFYSIDQLNGAKINAIIRRHYSMTTSGTRIHDMEDCTGLKINCRKNKRQRENWTVVPLWHRRRMAWHVGRSMS